VRWVSFAVITLIISHRLTSSTHFQIRIVIVIFVVVVVVIVVIVLLFVVVVMPPGLADIQYRHDVRM